VTTSLRVSSQGTNSNKPSKKNMNKKLASSQGKITPEEMHKVRSHSLQKNDDRVSESGSTAYKTFVNFLFLNFIEY